MDRDDCMVICDALAEERWRTAYELFAASKPQWPEGMRTALTRIADEILRRTGEHMELRIEDYERLVAEDVGMMALETELRYQNGDFRFMPGLDRCPTPTRENIRAAIDRAGKPPTVAEAVTSLRKLRGLGSLSVFHHTGPHVTEVVLEVQVGARDYALRLPPGIEEAFLAHVLTDALCKMVEETDLLRSGR